MLKETRTTKGRTISDGPIAQALYVLLNFVSISFWRRTDRQTDRQTDKAISISDSLRRRLEHWSITKWLYCYWFRNFIAHTLRNDFSYIFHFLAQFNEVKVRSLVDFHCLKIQNVQICAKSFYIFSTGHTSIVKWV